MQRRIAGLVAACALAFVLVACATTFGERRPTALTNTVQSACLEMRAAYQGYDNVCIIRKNCPAPERLEAKSLATDTEAFCATKPPDTAQNIARVQASVAYQRALGYGRR
jgi:hypothetical protein